MTYVTNLDEVNFTYQKMCKVIVEQQRKMIITNTSSSLTMVPVLLLIRLKFDIFRNIRYILA